MHDAMSEPSHLPSEAPVGEPEAVSPAEARARRNLIVGLVVAGLFLVAMLVLLVLLAIDARRVASTPVITIMRDAAIVIVAVETLVIGALLIVLMLQMRALLTLLRDELQPMLETLNDTVATVRGTTQFVSRNVVSPTIRAASYLAGVRRVVGEVTGLLRPRRRGDGGR